MSLEEMLECYKNKYGQEHIGHILKSVAYFDNMETGSWKSINMFHSKLNISDIKKKLVGEVNKYEINLVSSYIKRKENL